MDDLHIRTPRDDELDIVSSLIVDAYAEYAAHMSPDAWSAFAQQIANVRAQLGDAQLLVADRDGRIVGCVVLFTDWRGTQRDAYGVRMLAVPPEQRGTGVGHALMRECMERARRDGKRRIVCTVTQEMLSVRDMLEQLGFVRHPELDHEPAPGVRAQGYALHLDGSAEPGERQATADRG